MPDNSNTASGRSSIIATSLNLQCLRTALIIGLMGAVLAGHWITPDRMSTFHDMHALLLKLFILPVVLSAVWFGLRGALLVSALSTLFYMPLISARFFGHTGEAIIQYGEIATIWFTAILIGTFVDRERAAMHSLASMHEGALIALVSALDARERNTYLHSLRVRAYAIKIGHSLKLDNRSLVTLGAGALLHDVGKLGIPDAILLKHGTLTKKEWCLMRKHPEIGRKILASTPFLDDAAEIVYAHHERYDGTGYPRQLIGEEIPLCARIFSVADVFDALTTDRPYHEKIGYEQAIQEIKRGAGTQFDPAVVQAFLALPQTEWASVVQTNLAKPLGFKV